MQQRGFLGDCPDRQSFQARSGSLQETVSVHAEECTAPLAATSGEPQWWNGVPASLGRNLLGK
jgi:hypothetical protein